MPEGERSEETPAGEDLRAALLDQLAYLIDEVEALRPVVGQVPEALQQLPTTDTGLSLRQTYGRIAAYDEHVVLPQVQQAAAGEPLTLPGDDVLAEGDAAVNDQPIDALLDRVQAARQAVVDALDALPPERWTRPVTALAHRVTQRDADLLRAVGYHLEAAMPGRARSKK